MPVDPVFSCLEWFGFGECVIIPLNAIDDKGDVKMKIAILGAAGRMGKMLCKLAEGTDLEVVSKVDIADGYDRAWSSDVEGVIDFSYHTAVPGAVEKAAAAGIPYVIGTTGLTAEEQARVDAAAKKIPVVQSGNYSLGVNLLLELVKKAAGVLGPEYDIEVVEMHHKHKKDAPSGTALMLAKAAREGRGKREEGRISLMAGPATSGSVLSERSRSMRSAAGPSSATTPSCSRETSNASRSPTRPRAARRSPRAR